MKGPRYASFGVREYWVVDAIRQTVRTHRQPGADGYEDVREFTERDKVTASLLPGIAFRLEDLD